MRFLTAFAFSCLVPVLARAESPRLGLPRLLELARTSPRVAEKRAAARVADAKREETGRLWIPTLEVTAVGGPSPDIDCFPSSAECTRTEPQNVSLAFDGIFFRVDARAMAPLFTFGKIAAGSRAAKAGASAADALADATQADALLEVTRAYWGLKAAREILFMLDDGRDAATKELARVEEALEKGSADVSEQARYRLRSVLAEIEARAAETRRLEATALAGIRLYAADAAADVDETPLAALPGTLPPLATARSGAKDRRAEVKAARAGEDAARALADLESRRWWPDLVLVGQATIARATGADDPENAFANDPLNVTSFTAGIAARWQLDAGVRPSKVKGARADEDRAHHVAVFAERGVQFEAERAWGEAKDAEDRLKAATQGEKATKAWLVSTLQAAEAGLVEPKELADVLVAHFTMRGRVIQATYDWNVALATLSRATGETR